MASIDCRHDTNEVTVDTMATPNAIQDHKRAHSWAASERSTTLRMKAKDKPSPPEESFSTA